MDLNNLHYHMIHEDLKNLELSVDESKSMQPSISINDERKLNTRSFEMVSDISEIKNNRIITGSDLNPAISNRRFLLRPRKRLPSNSKENSDCDELVNLFNVVKKKPKLKTPNQVIKTKAKCTYLETIFEEPLVKKNGSLKLTSTSRVKRSITFSDFITKTKKNKRKAQIRKFKNKIVKARNLKLSVKDVQIKLDEINQG